MQLYDFQQAAIDAVFEYFNKNNGSPVICLPTGAGKSVTIAGLIHKILTSYPATRIIKLTHEKNIIKQNYNKIKTILPQEDVGVFSAGIGIKETEQRVIVGAVQTVVRSLDELKFTHVLLIDECHRVNTDAKTSYAKIIAKLREMNPKLRIIGFTATPFRTTTGSICKDSSDFIFNDIVYNMCCESGYKTLIENGYLSKLVTKRPKTIYNVTGLKKVGEDYNLKELSKITVDEKITKKIVKEIIDSFENRNKCIVFCTRIDHVMMVYEEFMQYAQNNPKIRPCFIHSKDAAADETLDAFKRGQFNIIVNANKLTTGFDDIFIDLVAVLRPTQSPSLWVQMVGRGMRAAPGKKDCLVLDFGQNALRLGPVDAPLIMETAPGKGDGEGEAPLKVCPECWSYVPIMATVCQDCGHHFVNASKYDVTGFSGDVLSSKDKTLIKYRKVKNISFNTIHPANVDRVKRYGGICAVKLKAEDDTTAFTTYFIFKHSSKTYRETAATFLNRITYLDKETALELVSKMALESSIKIINKELRPISHVYVKTETRAKVKNTYGLNDLDIYDVYGVNLMGKPSISDYLSCTDNYECADMLYKGIDVVNGIARIFSEGKRHHVDTIIKNQELVTIEFDKNAPPINMIYEAAKYANDDIKNHLRINYGII